MPAAARLVALEVDAVCGGEHVDVLHRVLLDEGRGVSHPARVRIARPDVEAHREDPRVEVHLERRHTLVRAVLGAVDHRGDPLSSCDLEHLLVEGADEHLGDARPAQVGHPVECERGHAPGAEADEEVAPLETLAQCVWEDQWPPRPGGPPRLTWVPPRWAPPGGSSAPLQACSEAASSALRADRAAPPRSEPRAGGSSSRAPAAGSAAWRGRGCASSRRREPTLARPPVSAAVGRCCSSSSSCRPPA
eukprot:scaffold49079_cov62-Phaeocystis_antarctica.AAC.3